MDLTFSPLVATSKAPPNSAPFPTLNQTHVRGIDLPVITPSPLPVLIRTQSKHREKRISVYITDVEYVVNQHHNCILPIKEVDCDDSFPIPNIRKPQIMKFTRSQLNDLVLKVVLKRHLTIVQPLITSADQFNAFDKNEPETQTWSTKYAPKQGLTVITSQKSGSKVTEWLNDKFDHLKKAPLSTSTPLGLLRVRKEKKKYKYDIESYDFIEPDENIEQLASSSDSDTLPNFLILCGPSGSGKTSSVYAAASELGAYVFELNPSDKRSSKKLFKKLGGMGRSHLVHRNETGEDTATDFKQKSVILLDEVDILFDKDQTFWTGLDRFVETSRRPVIMTCSNPSLIPPSILENHAKSFLQFAHAPTSLQIDALWLTALCEGHLVDCRAVRQMIINNKRDFRSSLNDLQFWCQMGLGEVKSGANWILTQKEREHTTQHDIRTISYGTYIGGSWHTEGNPLSFEELSDTSLEELDITVTPSSTASLSDWCSLSDSLSDADYLCSNKRTLLEVSVDEEYSNDKILGLNEITDLPTSVGPYLHELSIYPSITKSACQLFASRVQDQDKPLSSVNVPMLRESLWFLSSAGRSNSGATDTCIAVSSSTVMSTEIYPIIRNIARVDKWKEQENERIRIEQQGPASRRMMKTIFSSLGLEPNAFKKYLGDGDIDEILETAPSYWT